MSVILILLLIAGGGLLICKIAESRLIRNNTDRGNNESAGAINDRELRKRYNNFLIECPCCKSRYVRTVSDFERVLSVRMFGVLSSKMTNKYECTSCHKRF